MWGMEENGGKRGKMRTLQEGKAGKPKGMLDTESSRWKKSKEPKVSGEQWPLGFRPRQELRTKQCLASGAKPVTQSQADGKKVRSRRSTESNGRWGSDQDSFQGVISIDTEVGVSNQESLQGDEQ